MTEGRPFIELQIGLSNPPELSDLLGALAAFGRLFDEYLAKEHPALAGETRLLVKEIRQGSTVLELLPDIPALLATMDSVLIVDNFVTRYRTVLTDFMSGRSPPNVPANEIKDYLNTVKLLARDKKGSAKISSAVYKKSGTKHHIEFQFDTGGAQRATDLLERRTIELDTPIHEVKENVFMVFWQSNLDEKQPGRRTGQKAIIEAITPKPLAIRYATELVKQRFTYWIGKGDKNIYKLGFYIDCYVERLRGKPVAYNIYNLADVIDLPDDEN